MSDVRTIALNDKFEAVIDSFNWVKVVGPLPSRGYVQSQEPEAHILIAILEELREIRSALSSDPRL